MVRIEGHQVVCQPPNVVVSFTINQVVDDDDENWKGNGAHQRGSVGDFGQVDADSVGDVNLKESSPKVGVS